MLNPMGRRPGLPGIAVESVAEATVAANGGMSTWGFKVDQKYNFNKFYCETKERHWVDKSIIGTGTTHMQ